MNSELIRLGYAEADPEAAMNDDYKFDSTKVRIFISFLTGNLTLTESEKLDRQP